MLSRVNIWWRILRWIVLESINNHVEFQVSFVKQAAVVAAQKAETVLINGSGMY